MIINVNRTAKTVMEVFDDILGKESLSSADMDFIYNPKMKDIKFFNIDLYIKKNIDNR